jgi:hypothetical protein
VAAALGERAFTVAWDAGRRRLPLRRVLGATMPEEELADTR